jgi:hypothetical protein
MIKEYICEKIDVVTKCKYILKWIKMIEKLDEIISYILNVN